MKYAEQKFESFLVLQIGKTLRCKHVNIASVLFDKFSKHKEQWKIQGYSM